MINIDKKILAIIPARGGSKELPGKNIKNLAGKPLIAHSIQEAKKSKYIDRLVVSTDYDDIAQVAQDFGAQVIKRPSELAQDLTPTPPVLWHAIEALKEAENYQPDLILLLQPTSPMRKVRHIDEMIEKFFTAEYDSMVSVVFVHEPRFEISGDNYIKQVEKKRPSRQQRQATIFENGALYLTTPEIIKNNQMIGSKVGHYQMDKRSSVDVDDAFDLNFIEQLINQDKE